MSAVWVPPAHMVITDMNSAPPKAPAMVLKLVIKEVPSAAWCFSRVLMPQVTVGIINILAHGKTGRP